MMKKFSFLILLSVCFPVAAKVYAQKRTENLFYMVDSPGSFESFKKNIDQISIVCPQTFLVSKEGVLTGGIDHRVLGLAKEKGVKVIPLIVNKGFYQKLLHDIGGSRLLDRSQTRNREKIILV